MAQYITLGEVAGTARDGIASAETVLRTALNSIKQGTSVGIGDLFDLQYQMSAYTISANTFSSVLKEFSDTMKSVVQKST
ncbi:EscF/YscF/HrpA family type III secretion system needle major subunit [Noviherbaspirillum soli]|uniref:EscF/YscF/HrpA family type III secretion system needle major subunit n=1 Tax=Noviherbaspirillum soli TaxID=1064518 RepID=UPI00188CC9ED|nr:EscF/YscF/HrpA family type III secretion system needle major subunit [Noviherbaspirillum soli]